MAIFKLGKRIGPFDIRGGISRGDFKSSAYHKTDRDPRFKMQANTENTIGRFRAAMASAEGYARPNRFAIRLFPPTSLLQEIKLQNATTNRDGRVLDNEMYNGTGQAAGLVGGGVMNSLTQTIGRQINIHCDSVTMPGRDLVQQEVQYGSDVKRQMVQAHTYEGNISATFYADKFMRERQFMEFWQNLCVDPVTHTAGYYDDYVGSMKIYQLGAEQVMTTQNSPFDGDDYTGKDEYYMEGPRNSHRSQTTRANTREEYQAKSIQTYGIEVLEVFPATVGQIEYAYSSVNEVARIPVEFQYKSWITMENSSGIYK